MTITLLTLRGTSEPLNGSSTMLTRVTEYLDPAKYDTAHVVDIDYPASIGPVNAQNNPAGPSEQQSIDASIPLIAAAVRATPNLVCLLGYSLGAECVSRFLELKAQGLYGDCEIASAGFVANPRRAPGESIDPNPFGYGIAGAHGHWPAWIPTFTVANPADGITSCPSPSPLRTLNGPVSPLTFAVQNWNAGLAQQVLFNTSTSILQGGYTPAEWINAAALLRGYLVDGQHTTVYGVDGYCLRLAQKLNTL